MRLVEFIAQRFARAAATGTVPDPEAAEGEAAVAARMAATPSQARVWAEAAQTLPARAAGGRAVNLDAAALILDTLMRIEATARAVVPA